MKKTIYLTVILIAAIFMALTGCKKDKSELKELVVIKRSTGVLYTVNKTTGTLTEKMTITYNDSPLTNLRGLVFDPASGKCFAGSTYSGNGNFYSIDLATGAATLLNDNTDGNWDGIADMVIAPDGSILAEVFSNVVDNSALVKFDKVSGNEGTPYTIMQGSDELWSSGGLVYGNSSSQIIIGGESEIFVSNLTGAVTQTITVTGTTNIDDDESYIMDLEKDEDGTVYGMVYESNDLNQYLVRINTLTGELTEIKLLASGNNSTLYHCLAFIPESKLQ